VGFLAQLEDWCYASAAPLQPLEAVPPSLEDVPQRPTNLEAESAIHSSQSRSKSQSVCMPFESSPPSHEPAPAHHRRREDGTFTERIEALEVKVYGVMMIKVLGSRV
jgi:hypothetical protein